MNWNWKKMISIVLVVTVCTTGSAIAQAVECDVPQYTFSDENIEIVDPALFYDLFTQENDINAIQDDTLDASYKYTFAPWEDNADKSDVSVDFVVVVNGVPAYGSATGVVDAYDINAGSILWAGPLNGSIDINGYKYPLILGFTKMEPSQEVCLSITIQSFDNHPNMEPVYFSIGTPLITDGVEEYIRNRQVAVGADDISGVVSDDAFKANDFYQIGSDFGNFNGGLGGTSGIGQESFVYGNATTGTVMVTLRTHGDRIDKAFSGAGVSNSFVSRLMIKLNRQDYTDDSYSWIVGIEQYDFPSSSFGKSGELLMPLFNEILGVMGVPSNVISSALSGLTGVVTKENASTDAYYVSCEFSLLEEARFDKIETGLPIVFQLDHNSNYTGYSDYASSTEIMYRTYLSPIVQTKVHTTIPVVKIPLFLSKSHFQNEKECYHYCMGSHSMYERFYCSTYVILYESTNRNTYSNTQVF